MANLTATATRVCSSILGRVGFDLKPFYEATLTKLLEIQTFLWFEKFVVYLISRDRPISEVVAPRRKDISHEFIQNFEGMTSEPVSLDNLIETREALVAEIAINMPEEHKAFLLAFKRGEPDWTLLGVPGAAELPAVRWEQINLDKPSPRIGNASPPSLRKSWRTPKAFATERMKQGRKERPRSRLRRGFGPQTSRARSGFRAPSAFPCAGLHRSRSHGSLV